MILRILNGLLVSIITKKNFNFRVKIFNSEKIRKIQS